MAAAAAPRKQRRNLPLMRSYARIKPASADKKGGVAAKHSISGWDTEGGRVAFAPSVEGARRNETKAFDHYHHAFAPADSQARCYEVACAPLVAQWIGGFDCDLICYGQTGSGKTYTQFGPPKSMAKALKALGDTGGSGTISDAGIMREEHGFILRTGFAALAAVDAINRAGDGGAAVLHGSMVEMSILSAKSQNAGDLLAGKKECFVDRRHHLEGAVHVPLADARGLVELASAVETRLTRGTKMNNSSSRSHCITVFTLHHRSGDGNMRVSRLQFFDFMGSERFKGSNAAHDESRSAHATMAGAEGIYANFSLLFLGEAVRAASKARRKKESLKKKGSPGVNMERYAKTSQGFLNQLLSGSLVGHAVTAMITCLSCSERNGAESFLSCKYSRDMAKLPNDPKQQQSVTFAEAVAEAKKERSKSAKILAKGVKGKYMAKRKAEVEQCETTLRILEGIGPPSRREGRE